MYYLMQYAMEVGIETGRKVRIDSTVVESNIHGPSDSTLLWDGIKVITRCLEDGQPSGYCSDQAGSSQTSQYSSEDPLSGVTPTSTLPGIKFHK